MAAISREQGDLVYEKICQIKDETVEGIKKKARELDKAVAQRDLSPLLNQAYSDFKSKVYEEYQQTSYADLAEMLLPKYKTYFLSDDGLNREICQIIDTH